MFQKFQAKEDSKLIQPHARTSVAPSSRVSTFFNPSRASYVPSKDEVGLPDQGASITASIINFVNTILGSGLLALPTVFGSAGYVLGVFFVLLFGVLSVFTNYIVVECCLLFGRPTTFAFIANKAMPGLSIVADLSIVINSIGALIAYIMIAADCFEAVANGPRTIWVIVALCISFPLTMLRNLDALRVTSFIAIFFLMFITITVILFCASQDAPADSILQPCPPNGTSASCPPGETVAVNSDPKQVLGAAANLGVAYAAVFGTPSIYNEIITPTRGSMLKVGLTSYSIATVLYLVVGICGYATFGPNVESNILNSYPTNGLVSVARIGLACVVLFSYPVLVLCSRVCIIGVYDYFAACCCKKGVNGEDVLEPEPLLRASQALESVRENGHMTSYVSRVTSEEYAEWSAFATAEEKKASCGSSYFVTDLKGVVATVLLSTPPLIVALSVQDVGVVFSFTGAIAGSFVIFIIPGLMYFRLFAKDGWTCQRTLAFCCIPFGFILMILGVSMTVLTS